MATAGDRPYEHGRIGFYNDCWLGGAPITGGNRAQRRQQAKEDRRAAKRRGKHPKENR